MEQPHNFVSDGPDNPSHCIACGKGMSTEQHFYAQYRGVAEDVIAEAARASTLHSKMNSHHEAYAVIREEFEHEYWPLVCQNPRKCDDAVRRAGMREELIQTAAMCLRALHDLC